VICFNDEAAIGALLAARERHREEDLLIVGMGADRRLREELRRQTPSIVGSTAFWPESYGEQLIQIALAILAGEPVPPAIYSKHLFIDARNVDQYYVHADNEH
jgi:ribose transport system substrate-binding protein